MNTQWFNQMLFLIFIMGFFCDLPIVKAQIFFVKEAKFYEQIPVQVVEDANNELTLQDVTHPTNEPMFQDWKSGQLDLKINTYYWTKIELENQLPTHQNQEDWVIKIPVLSYLEAYIQREDGTFEKQLSGRFTSLHDKKFAPTFEGNLIRFQLPHQQVATIFIRGKSERMKMPPNFKISLQPLDFYYFNHQPEQKGNALFIGFVLMMLIYNIISYFFGRHPSFLYYSGYLLTLVIYDSFIAGFLIDWLPIEFFLKNPKYYYVIKLVIYPGLMCYMAFICSILDLKNLLPFWYRFYVRLIKLGLWLIVLDISITIWSNYSFQVADYVTVLFIFLFIISSFLFLIPLYRSKSKLGIYILVGIIAMAAGFLVSGFNRLLSVDFSLTPFRIGTILEILAFSLGLAYRQRQNERAKQLARFELEKIQILEKQQEAETRRLAELDEFKNRLITNITHEFRTPLTVIQGRTQQINAENHGREAKLILQSTHNLLNLVNQMLDLIQLESGQLELHLWQGDIVSFSKSIVEEFAVAAKENELQLSFQASESQLLMDFDKEKMRQILTNLLGNALKFSKKSGRIELKLEKKIIDHQAFLKLQVHDNGIGIAAEDLPHIFDRFYQVSAAKKMNVSGSGIGLALVKELVNLMGGEISVECQLKGETIFMILLPIAKKLTHPTIENNTKSGLLEKNELSNNFKNNILNPTKKPEILIVEDNRDIIEYLKDCLQNDYKIITASNGKMGVEKCIQHLPAIVISDIAMPEMDGLDLTQTLKTDERTNHIPIILLTARANQEAKLEGLKSGADAYLYKPFDKNELLIRLKKLTESRQNIQQHFSITHQLFPDLKTKDEKEESFLQELNDQIEKHLDNENLTVVALAEKMLLSRAQLFRKVKKITGMSVQNYLSLVRLQHAKNLLETTDESVSEICFQVGFADLSHFSRKFSKQFGFPPSQRRKI